MKILFDFDNVLNNLDEVWVKQMNRIYHTEVSYDDITEYDIQKIYPQLTGKQIFLPYLDGTLYTDISPIKPAQALIHKLAEEGHELYVATANILGIKPCILSELFYEQFNVRAMQYLLEFLWQYYPEIPPYHIIISPHKPMIQADVLVDDNPAFLRHGSYKRILLDKPYNRDIDDGYFRIYRAKNWEDVEKYIKEGTT